jgi:hypothetical protein
MMPIPSIEDSPANEGATGEAAKKPKTLPCRYCQKRFRRLEHVSCGSSNRDQWHRMTLLTPRARCNDMSEPIQKKSHFVVRAGRTSDAGECFPMGYRGKRYPGR